MKGQTYDTLIDCSVGSDPVSEPLGLLGVEVEKAEVSIEVELAHSLDFGVTEAEIHCGRVGGEC